MEPRRNETQRRRVEGLKRVEQRIISKAGSSVAQSLLRVKPKLVAGNRFRSRCFLGGAFLD
jgi:hypothetical protein